MTREDELRRTAGLCGNCAHALIRHTRRGTSYLRCALAATEARFAKYPRLPKRECAGYIDTKLEQR